MSLRALGVRIFNHGTLLVRHLCKRDINLSSNIANKINVASKPATQQRVSQVQITPSNFLFRNVGSQIGLQARRILIDNVLNRVTNRLASDLKKKAAKRILYGDSGPFFALVGVSLASGTGILTREDELEGVCGEIREAISKIKWKYHDIDIEANNSLTLKDLSVGKPIATGAFAAVYAAKIKQTTAVNDYKFREEKENLVKQEQTDGEKYPLALKMMFNYDIQSNAMAILRSMYREAVPARLFHNNVGSSEWELDVIGSTRYLPPHPNIVAIFSVFTDFIPDLQNCRGLFPDALPQRIYPEGSGRNMSLFLLMKRYETTLQQSFDTDRSVRSSVLLFAQLLEAIDHLVAHGIAHRDLKSDNILLDTTEKEAPILVISDFGCCLADKSHGLLVPYNSREIDKGGNTALMAPEIYFQKPGTLARLNYTKSDLWAAGAIAYEIFGLKNPFYEDKDTISLKNFTYVEEQLPELPKEVPNVVRSLVRNLLSRNPNKRVHPEIAANVCQLHLWAPSVWLRPGLTKLPSSAEILQWLLSLTTKVLCEGRLNKWNDESDIYKGGRRTYPEYLLISSFLCRASICNIRSALSWIQDNVFESDY